MERLQNPEPLRLATRSSALAVAQTELVARKLKEAGYRVELVRVARQDEAGPATGDKGERAAATDKGRFVRGVEHALLDGRADIAVHSAKDLPSDLLPGLTLAGTPVRADAADAWVPTGADDPTAAVIKEAAQAKAMPESDPVAGPLSRIPKGARVGTASHRRRSQLLALRPDLVIEELRGNVETRLRLAAERGLDGAVLATAGLRRLGLEQRIGFRFGGSEMLPAAGQGTLALEIRRNDGAAAAAVAKINDPSALAELIAERAVVAGLDADCDTPVAALAVAEGATLTLVAYAGRGDGGDWVRDRLTGASTDAAGLGARVAARMLAAGADEVLGR